MAERLDKFRALLRHRRVRPDRLFIRNGAILFAHRHPTPTPRSPGPPRSGKGYMQPFFHQPLRPILPLPSRKGRLWR